MAVWPCWAKVWVRAHWKAGHTPAFSPFGRSGTLMGVRCALRLSLVPSSSVKRPERFLIGGLETSFFIPGVLGSRD